MTTPQQQEGKTQHKEFTAIAFFLFGLLTLRATIFRDLLPNVVFYLFVIILNVYVLYNFGKKGKLDIRALYLCVICIISLLINTILGNLYPVLNSWTRLFIFLLSFNIAGPLLGSEKLHLLREHLYEWSIRVTSWLLVLNAVYISMTGAISITGTGGFLESPNSLGTIAATAIIIFLVSYIYTQNYKSKILYFGLFFLSIPIILLSASRAAILGCAVCVFVIFVLKFKKTVIHFTFSLIILIVAYPKIAPFAEFLMNKIEARNESGDISAGRTEMYTDNFRDLQQNPLIGAGFYNIINNQNTKINADGSLEYPSGWLFILSSTGILGFLYFLAIIFLFFSHFSRFRKSANKIDFLCAILFIYFLIHMNFEGYVYSGGGFTFFVLWLTIHRIIAIIKHTNQLNLNLT